MEHWLNTCHSPQGFKADDQYRDRLICIPIIALTFEVIRNRTDCQVEPNSAGIKLICQGLGDNLRVHDDNLLAVGHLNMICNLQYPLPNLKNQLRFLVERRGVGIGSSGVSNLGH